jgi:hypothetical protein
VKKLIVLILLVVLGYGFVQGLNVFKAKSDFAARVEHQLDFVSDSSTDSVKQDLVKEAQKFGIELAPTDIHISYEDTEVRSVAQQIVGNRLGAQFTNKRVTINVRYDAHILGIPFSQEITQSKIKQVGATRMPMRTEERQLLDPTGASALPSVQ